MAYIFLAFYPRTLWGKRSSVVKTILPIITSPKSISFALLMYSMAGVVVSKCIFGIYVDEYF